MNKGILKSKRMIGMIITLAAGAVIMLGLAVYMFIFAAQSQEIYFDFSDFGSFGERLQQSKTILYLIAFGNLLIAAEKIVPLIASILMYRKYPDTKGLKVLKVIAIVGAVFYCLLFAGLLVWSIPPVPAGRPAIPGCRPWATSFPGPPCPPQTAGSSRRQ